MISAFKDKKFLSKVLVTLLILSLFIIGRTIKAPGFSSALIDIYSNSYLTMLSLLGGGALEQISILALGISPYINASIIVQLLSMDVIPYLSELKEEGKKGQKKLEYIMFCLSIILSLLQGFFLARTLNDYVIDQSTKGYIFIGIMLTLGSIALYALSKVIDKWGIGNGVSLIIFAGIVSGLPYQFTSAYNSLSPVWFVIYVIMFIAIILGVIFIQMSERRIPLQYSKSINTTKGNLNHLPIKINFASVIPVIFASSVIQAPQIIVSWINGSAYNKLSNAMSFNNWYMILIYAALIIGFTFFYTHQQFDVKKVANNLKKQGAYVPAVRPGQETANYIKNILNKVTLLGAVLLTGLAILPYIIAKLTGINISLGGTGLIIVVGVAMEVLETIKTEGIQNKYHNRRFF